MDRDDYLLGRPIDKSLEQLNETEKHQQLGVTQPKNHVEHECIPPSIRDYNKLQAVEQQVTIKERRCKDWRYFFVERNSLVTNIIPVLWKSSTIQTLLHSFQKRLKLNRNRSILFYSAFWSA